MSASGKSSPGSPRSPPEQEGTLDSLRQEVEVLQTKLGELHGTDLVALRRAYATLTQHVSALESEWEGTLERAASLHTEVVSPEYIAQELGVAGALAVGLTLVQHTLRGVMGRDVLARGAWLLGAGVVVFRLTGGTLARWVCMVRANMRIKRDLLRRLHAVDDRIRIMAALQTWGAAQGAVAAGTAPPRLADSASGSAELPGSAVSATQRAPASAGSAAASASSSSSLEMVERPEGSETRGPARGPGSESELGREALRRYARLGKKR